ncbi:lipopolysaccharide biosynthesis protein [Haladaptatus sp. GCM10025707]|uniref:lipopolysaccharide biosynthesis protein n=1 Tax=unclassified Haladaptatus TaxID=2622732 RepID=UPI0023E7A37C|nr:MULTISPECIES: polysaccharide biosynthesis C-terminal domain-containing protein [unclassified Haladaptatus]
MNRRIDNLTTQFFQDFGHYAVGAILPAMVGTAAIVVLTRAFSPDLYGQYALAMVFVMVASTIAAGWIGQSILRLEPELETAPLIANALVSLASVIGVALMVGILVYLARPFDDETFRWLFAGGLMLVIAQSLFSVTKSLLQARLDSKRAALLKMCNSGSHLLLGLPLAILVFDHPVGWMVGAAIGTVVSVSLIWNWGLERPRFAVQRTVLKRMVTFGFPMIGWLLGFTLLSFIDRVLLQFLMNSRAVGLYASNYELANKALPLALAPVIQASHSIIMNTWEGNNPSSVQSAVSEMTRYLLIVGVPVTALVAVSSRALSGILLDKAYFEGHTIIPIIAISVFLFHLAMLAHKGLEVKEKTGTMFFGVLVATLLNVGLNFLAIPRYGFEGAAGATLVSFGFYLMFATAVTERHIPWRPPIDTIRNVCVGTAILSGVAIFVYHVIGYSLVGLLTAGVLAGTAYLLSLFAIGEFSHQERKTLKATLEYFG